MAEYKLSYTANEIDERLGKVSTLENKVNEMDVQADYTQNDADAVDYIKNRPLYSTGEYDYIELLNTSEIGKFNAVFYFIPNAHVVLEEGQSYQVIINKTNEYFLTAYRDEDGFYCLGKTDIESFSISPMSNIISISVKEGFTISHLQINKAVERIQYLDKKYVANFIAGERTANQEAKYKEKTYICKEGAEKFNIGNIAIGLNSHAEGSSSVAFGDNSHAEGSYTEALEESAHAEGTKTQATNYCAHAEGKYTLAAGNSSHAEGGNTQALNYYSHAEGEYTIANAMCLHVQGRYNIPDDAPAYSRTWTVWTDYPKYDGDKVIYIFNDEPTFNANEGTSTIVTMPYQASIKDLKENDYFVFSYPESEIIDTYYYADELVSQETNSEGKTLYKWKYSGASYSSNLNDGTYLHIVGNGDTVYDENLKTHVIKRSNAHTLDWNGDAWYAGDVYVGSTSGTNRDEGSKKLATEDEVAELREALQTLTEEFNALKESLNS